jgi:PAS domain S-box-containing protein
MGRLERKDRTLIVLVLAAGLGLAVATYLSVVAQKSDGLVERFLRHADTRIDAVDRRIVGETTILRSIVGLFQGSVRVERLSFSAFASLVAPGGSSFQALEWIPRIERAERRGYVQSARRDGLAGFRITERAPSGKVIEAGVRDRYFPVYYVEPLEGNEGAVGFDLASNPTRRAALAKARDSGKLVTSSAIKLVQLKENNTGVLLFAPIYQSGVSTATIEGKRRNLSGFALGVVRVSSLIGGDSGQAGKAARDISANLDLYVFDKVRASGKRLLYVHSSPARSAPAPDLTLAAAQTGTHLTRSLFVGDREWLVVARPDAPSLTNYRAWEAWVQGIGILIITAMLAGYFHSNARRAQVITALVEQRTAELSQATDELGKSEARHRSVVENAVDGIVSIDSQGIVTAFNAAAEEIFGHTAAEVTGRNVNMLMPDPFHREHDGYLRRYRQSGVANIIGKRLEVEGQRKDGSVFPLDISISETNDTERQMFTGIVRDITDRKQAEMAKNEFVSIVSHELRTPLTSIKGSLGLIQGGALGALPEKVKSMTDIAYANCERLVELINDILDMEKIESGKMDFQMQPMEIESLFSAVMQITEGLEEAYEVRFEFPDKPHTRSVTGDKDRLVQVMSNLLSNAAKFSAPGDTIEITCEKRNGGLRISVSDRGSGIPEEFKDRIFQKFSQADQSDTRAKGGSGLGLSISKAIVEQHGGVIGYDDRAGGGTTFVIDLPEVSSANTRH